MYIFDCVDVGKQQVPTLNRNNARFTSIVSVKISTFNTSTIFEIHVYNLYKKFFLICDHHKKKTNKLSKIRPTSVGAIQINK